MSVENYHGLNKSHRTNSLRHSVFLNSLQSWVFLAPSPQRGHDHFDRPFSLFLHPLLCTGSATRCKSRQEQKDRGWVGCIEDRTVYLLLFGGVSRRKGGEFSSHWSRLYSKINEMRLARPEYGARVKFVDEERDTHSALGDDFLEYMATKENE